MLLGVSTGLSAALALAAVLGLIWLASRAARLTGLATPPAANGRSVAVQEVIALDSRRRLYLVRCLDRHVLLMTGGERDRVIGWLPDPDTGGRV